MDLDGRDVIVDTYNLRLRKGSGIKTYGVTLVEALERLGANVSLLTDRPAGGSGDPVLREILAHDRARPRRRWRRAIRSGIRAAKRNFFPLRATPFRQEHVIPDDDLRLPGTSKTFYNVPELYDFANEKFKRFKRFTTVRVRPRPAIYHATTALPIRVPGALVVSTIHDLIPLRMPWSTLDDKRFFYRLVGETLRRSDLVLAISECTKQDILTFFDVPEERIAVTYQSLPAAADPPDLGFCNSTLERLGLDRGRYLLFVGNIEPKKNVRALIEAAAMIRDPLPVVIVGRKAWLWKEQLEGATRYFGGGADDRIRILGFLPDRVVGALYANALCLVFPSLYEGFGLPPLEAMRHGCPVVVSNTSSLPEVCGNAALYVDPRHPEQIRDRVGELIESGSRREALTEAGYRRVEHFGPERYAERLRAAYARLRD